jgi:CRP-like cAMP-binding protein
VSPAEPTEGETRAWHRLTPAEQAALTDAGYHRAWNVGEIIASQGGPPDAMYIIMRGLVKISVANDRGEHAPIAARGAGEIVGELGTIGNRPRIATMEALTEVMALVIPPERLRNVLRTRPHIAEELIRAAAVRFEQAAHLHLEAGGPDFPQRLASVLLELAIQCAPNAPNHVPITLPFTQDDLASLARVSRSTLIRGLEELRSKNIVQTSRGRTTIVDLPALREHAGEKRPS